MRNLVYTFFGLGCLGIERIACRGDRLAVSVKWARPPGSVRST